MARLEIRLKLPRSQLLTVLMRKLLMQVTTLLWSTGDGISNAYLCFIENVLRMSTVQMLQYYYSGVNNTKKSQRNLGRDCITYMLHRATPIFPNWPCLKDDLDPHLIHHSFGPPNPTTQMASWSSLYFYKTHNRYTQNVNCTNKPLTLFLTERQHNRFTAGLEYVRVHPGQQVPER